MPRPGIEAPIVALDLDGTLGDYHRHFEQFATMWTGRKVVWDPTVNGSFAAQLGMSKALYRKCKLAFRMGGMKRSMPAFEYASELTRLIRGRGVQVLACTTRPYLQMTTIDGDTQHWIRRNRIQVDGIIYGEHKYRDLVKSVGRERVVCVLEDDLSQIKVARSLGLLTILRCNEANTQFARGSDQMFALDLESVSYTILELIDQHKKRTGIYASR
jgi:hypothetical protein